MELFRGGRGEEGGFSAEGTGSGRADLGDSWPPLRRDVQVQGLAHCPLAGAAPRPKEEAPPAGMRSGLSWSAAPSLAHLAGGSTDSKGASLATPARPST